MNGHDDGSHGCDRASSTDRGRRNWTTATQRLDGLAVLVATSVLALAACGSGPGSPHVASLGESGENSKGTTTTQLKGNPTQLLNEWAVCMRRHGDLNQADPTIDSNDDIDITWNPAITGGINGTNKGGQGDAGPGQYCREYLTAAQSALGGNRRPQSDQAVLEKFSQCMRANGVPNFPDPTPGGGLSFPVGSGGDLNPNNSTFRNASHLCAQRTGAQVPGAGGNPPTGTIKLNGLGPP